MRMMCGPMGRNATGVRGMNLAEKDYIVGMATTIKPEAKAAEKEGEVAPEVADLVPEKGSLILSVTENGYGKRTPADEYRLTNRGGKGVINVKTTGAQRQSGWYLAGDRKIRGDADQPIRQDHPHRFEVHSRVRTFSAGRAAVEYRAGRPGRGGSGDSARRAEREWDADSVNEQGSSDCAVPNILCR